MLLDLPAVVCIPSHRDRDGDRIGRPDGASFLRALAALTGKISWSANLVTALIEELYVEDGFHAGLCRASAKPPKSVLAR